MSWGSAVLAILYRDLCQATKPDKMSIAYSCCSHGFGGDYHFYIPEWNHGPSYVRLPKQIKNIGLLLDQRSEAEFPIWSISPDLESLASRICYQWRRGVDNFIRRGNDEWPSNVGPKEVPRRVRHRLYPNKHH
ncbi:hypothetical protein PVK06_034175 [Gossypium arboreum]|uniref:Uncharacterized protein n=1 Tax=Gossypium arboreum TaxID=29729 RepID=A0ABR0NDF1_GOSAR|nr:hypothetical protein PVK06_034175 [Gossypium arboreum]